MFKSSAASDRKLPASAKQQLPEGAAPPPSMQWAVRLMQAGAAASTIYLIFAAAITSTVKSSLTSWNAAQPKSKQLTAAQISSTATYLIVTTIIVGLIAIGLWIWMARMNSAGRSWARITATVLFVLWSYYTYTSIGDARGAAMLIISMVIVLVTWVIGLGALIMLWRPDSTAFFRAQSSR